MNFRLSKCFIWDDILERHAFHSQNTLAQSFCIGSDHPGLPRMIRPNSDFQHWVSPDDPTLVRMIRAKDFVSTWKGQAGWSGRTPDDPDLGNSSVFLAYSVSTLDDPRLLRMIREPPENTQRSLSGVGVYIPLHPLHLLLSLSPTNHASKAFFPSLLSILELDSCKETPRDWEEVRFEVWFESTPWASTCSSQEAFEATSIRRFAFVTLGALLLDG